MLYTCILDSSFYEFSSQNTYHWKLIKHLWNFMSMEIQRYLYIFIAIKIQHCSCSEKWWRNLLILKLLEELFVYFIWTSTPEIPFHIYIVQSCCIWQFHVMYGFQSPGVQTPPLSSVPLLVLMREKWSVSQMNKTEKKKCHLNLKKCFFFLPFSINVNLLHKRKITIKQ